MYGYRSNPASESKKPWEHRSMLLGKKFTNQENVSKKMLGRKKERGEERRNKEGLKEKKEQKGKEKKIKK